MALSAVFLINGGVKNTFFFLADRIKNFEKQKKSIVKKKKGELVPPKPRGCHW